MLAVAATDEIHLRALQLDQCGIQLAKTPPKASLHLQVGGANLAGQDLRVGIAGGAEETEADQGRLLPADLLDDDLVRRVRVRLIEHHALVAGAFEHRRERHDADGRKAHDPDVAVLSPRFRRKRVELWVANVDEKHTHRSA